MSENEVAGMGDMLKSPCSLLKKYMVSEVLDFSTSPINALSTGNLLTESIMLPVICATADKPAMVIIKNKTKLLIGKIVVK